MKDHLMICRLSPTARSILSTVCSSLCIGSTILACAPPRVSAPPSAKPVQASLPIARVADSSAAVPPARDVAAQAQHAGDDATGDSTARMSELHRARHDESWERDYIVGPGDVLSVRAIDLADLNQRVRIDGKGTISLPLVNTVEVAGRTVAQVQDDLTKRLSQFMYNPHVSVFIEEYRSQQVAVVGAVQRPGLVSQTAATSTVLDAIAAAGGMTAEAGSRIYLIAAESRINPQSEMLAIAASSNAQDVTDGVGLRDSAPLFVDTKEASSQGQRLFFSLPVRGGDVIIVPRTGHFIAEGWVGKPGTYPLQSGLTLRGALAIAGGLSFPADTSSIKVYRAQASGNAESQRINYDEIVAERMPDVVIQEGDLIEVASSKAKLVPYGVYKTVGDLIHFGMRLPIP
jgi:polysaccharide export outer membrane protein